MVGASLVHPPREVSEGHNHPGKSYLRGGQTRTTISTSADAGETTATYNADPQVLQDPNEDGGESTEATEEVQFGRIQGGTAHGHHHTHSETS